MKKQTCDNTSYCRVNRTKLRPMGNKCDMECPICGCLYPDPGPTPQEINQRLLDRIRGV